MGKLGFLTIMVALAFPAAASAQQKSPAGSNSCQRFAANAAGAVSRDVIYLQAACVAARAGVTSPGNGPLSRDELISILMLMSLPEHATSHTS
jgi:hypothetical protein